MRQFFHPLLRPISSRIYMKVAEQVRQDDRERRIANETKWAPDLSAKHIQNLQVMIDRETFLKMLPEQAVVAEIGVAEGDFSQKILSITNPKILHLIDSWAHDERYTNLRHQVEERFQEQIRSGRVFVHQGFSTNEMAKFSDDYFDWVYIDTGHDYEVTCKELEVCRKKVKENGIIAGHDYIIGQWDASIRYGVIEAVHEFCIKYGWEMIYLTHESHRHLSFALKPFEN